MFAVKGANIKSSSNGMKRTIDPYDPIHPLPAGQSRA